MTVGSIVTEVPDYSATKVGKSGKVVRVKGDRVRVKWSLFDRKWYEYSDQRREVINKNQFDKLYYNYPIRLEEQKYRQQQAEQTDQKETEETDETEDEQKEN